MRASDLRETILEAVGDRLTAAELNVMLVDVFFRTQLKLVDDRWAGQPFILPPYATEHIVEPIFGTLDRYGHRRYTEALIVLPRKHAKTTITAGLGLYFLFMEPVVGQEIVALAFDEDQARVILGFAQGMIDQNPLLKQLVGGKTYKNMIHLPEINAKFYVIPHKTAAGQAIHPRIAICDEPHTYPNMDVVNALRSGMGGREEPLTIGITTAGPKRMGPLWEWIKSIKKDPHGYLYWQGARDDEDAADRKVWRRVNIAPWITMAYLRDEYRRLTRADFEQYHLNRFPLTSKAGRAFRWLEWKRCQKAPVIEPDEPCVVTVDGALKGDCFAIMVDRRAGDGTHHVEPYIFEEPPPDSGYYDLDEIEEFLASLWQTRNVARMALDPSRLLLLMQRLERHHGITVEEFGQTNTRMCPASSTLRELVRTGHMRAGKSISLKEHMLNAIEMPREPIGWRLGRESKAEKIDGAIALAMATYLAEAEVDAGPSFAETGGIRTITAG
jgi:phage terminase large subunit-like protein